MTFGLSDATCTSACTCQANSRASSCSKGKISAVRINRTFRKHLLDFRNFDCLLFGDHGVKIVPPEQGYPVRPNDVDIDDGDDEIEDYDENVVRSLAEKMVG